MAADRSDGRSGSRPPRRRSAFTPPRNVRLRDGEGRRVAPDAAVPSGGAGEPHREDGERLQKVLARAGFGSRRACEALISGGRVRVDGEVVQEQGVRVDPAVQVIHVDGRRLQLDDSKLTLVLNKPRAVVSAMSDPEGRRDLSEFTAAHSQRLYHVGRLDFETEGLLLLTNDGELAHRLTHPSFEVEKTYVCRFDAPGGPRAAWSRRCAKASSSTTVRPAPTAPGCSPRTVAKPWSR